MICRHCDTEIDTRIREADGSVICPGCGAVYRPKNTRQEPTAPHAQRDIDQSAIQSQRQHTRRASNSYADYQRPAKRSKAPAIIAIVVAFVVIVCSVATIVFHLHTSANNEIISSEYPVVGVGKQSISDQINEIINYVNNGSDYQEIENYFDLDAAIAYLSVQSGAYKGSFSNLIKITKDLDKGVDYLRQKYPSLDSDFGRDESNPLTSESLNFEKNRENLMIFMANQIEDIRQYDLLPPFDNSYSLSYDEENKIYEYSIEVNNTESALPTRSFHIWFYESDGRYIPFLVYSNPDSGQVNWTFRNK